MVGKLETRGKAVVVTSIYAIIVGIVVGVLDAIFGRGLLAVSQIRMGNPVLWILPLPLAGLAILYLYKRYGGEASKGMSLLFEVGLEKRERIPLVLIPLIMLTTWMTHLFGGSAGREGVAVQIGGTVAHYLGRDRKYCPNSRTCLITGMTAGFGGLFQTPIAATFFAMEVLSAGTIHYQAMLPAFLSASVASFTSHTLGLEKFQVSCNEVVTMDLLFVGKLILLGLLFGAVGGGFAFLLKKLKQCVQKVTIGPYKRMFLLAVVLGLCLILVGQGRYSGLGTNLIEASFANKPIYVYDWILKLVFTVTTLAIGFQGGEVTPLFAIGASLGIVLGNLFGLPIVLVAALGYTAVFSAATRTLLGPIMIGVEVFGGTNVISFIVVCMIAYYCNGGQTIYSKQGTLSL